MRSKVAQRILDETPEEVKVFAAKYAALVVKINASVREAGDENNLNTQSLKKELLELIEFRKK